MARRNERYPIPFAKRILTIDGGMVNRVDDLSLEDNQFAELRDWVYDPAGNLKMRNGITAITNVAGGDSVKYADKWVRDDVDTYYDIVISDDGKVYYKNGLTLTELLSGLTAESMVCTESFTDPVSENRLYIASRGDAVEVIDDDLSTRTAGCAVPDTKPTVALNGVGVKTGNHYYATTWLFPWGESSKSPTSSLIAPSSQKVLVTLGDAYPAGATGAKIYCTVAGSTELEELATITNPTTEYDDNNTDGVLGDAIPEDHDIPPVSRWMVMYKGFMYYIKDNSSKVGYSEYNYPEIVQTSAYDQPIKDIKNRPICIDYTANPNFLVWFYQKSIIAYSGTSPFLTETDPLVKKEINWSLGTNSPYTVRRVGGDLVFFGNDNRLYSLSRVSLAISETVEPEPLSEPIDKLLQEDLNQDMVPYFQLRYLNRKIFLFVATGTSSYLNKLLVYDLNLKTKPWYTALPAGGGMSLGMIEDDSGKEQLYIGGKNTLNLYQYDIGDTDIGTQVDPYLKSKKYDLGYPFNRKVWRKLRIFGEGTPEFQFDLVVTTTKDGVEKAPQTFTCRGDAISGGSTTTQLFGDPDYAFAEGCFTSSPSWNSDVANFKIEKDIRDDGELMQFEIENVSSTYKLFIKKFEITGELYKPRAA